MKSIYNYCRKVDFTIFPKKICESTVRSTVHSVSHCGNFTNSLPSCDFFRETICSKMTLLPIKKCYFFLIARHLWMIICIKKFYIRSCFTWNLCRNLDFSLLFSKTNLQSWLYSHHNISLPVQSYSGFSTDLKSLIPYLTLLVRTFLRQFAPLLLKLMICNWHFPHKSLHFISREWRFDEKISKKLWQIFCVISILCVWKLRNLLSLFFGKNFVKVTLLLKKLLDKYRNSANSSQPQIVADLQWRRNL